MCIRDRPQDNWPSAAPDGSFRSGYHTGNRCGEGTHYKSIGWYWKAGQDVYKRQSMIRVCAWSSWERISCSAFPILWEGLQTIRWSLSSSLMICLSIRMTIASVCWKLLWKVLLRLRPRTPWSMPPATDGISWRRPSQIVRHPMIFITMIQCRSWCLFRTALVWRYTSKNRIRFFIWILFMHLHWKEACSRCV